MRTHLNGAWRKLGKISRLPWSVRRPLNEKLRDNRQLTVIAQWLFEQTAPEDLPDLGLKQGDAFEKLYTGLKEPIGACCDSLSHYRGGDVYRSWLQEELRIGSFGALLSRFDAVGGLGKDAQKNADGVSAIALSMILDRMDRLSREESGASVAELKDLARSIATVNSALVASQKSAIDQQKLDLLKTEFDAAQEGKQRVKLTPEEKEQRYKEIFGIS